MAFLDAGQPDLEETAGDIFEEAVDDAGDRNFPAAFERSSLEWSRSMALQALLCQFWAALWRSSSCAFLPPMINKQITKRGA